MSNESGPTQKIAEFVAGTHLADVPPQAIEGAKLSILDTLACGFAALSQPVAQAIAAHVESLGGKPIATVLGAAGYKTSPPLAAMANGCLVNLLDYDGWFHAPTHTLPAALAIGELVGASGADVLEAYILATEVADRLQKVIEARRNQQAGPTYRGWYHVSLYGPLTASLAAGKLLRLDVPQLQGAMGGAACGSGGVRQNLGAKIKSFNSGNASSVGVQAAMLAQRGVTGDPNILEARVGLVHAVCLPGEYDWSPVESLLGNPYTLDGARVSTKKYPAVGPTQSVIGTLAQIRQEGRFTPEDIDWIEARVATFSAVDAAAEDELAAGFSWPHILATTALDGRFGVDHLSRASIDDPGVREMAAKVRITPPPPGERERIAVHLRDGRTLEDPIDPRLGRLDHDGLLQKYRDCTAGHLSGADADRLYEQVMGLDRLESISELTATMAGSEEGVAHHV
jgi:2-methylcitrate dehydratase PrpD